MQNRERDTPLSTPLHKSGIRNKRCTYRQASMGPSPAALAEAAPPAAASKAVRNFHRNFTSSFLTVFFIHL